MKIVNYRKFITSIALSTVVLLLALLTLFSSVSAYTTPNYSSVYVEYGDTLWSISEIQSNTNLYYQGKDIRYIVKDIRDINNLTSCSIQPGQELLIPTYK